MRGEISFKIHINTVSSADFVKISRDSRTKNAPLRFRNKAATELVERYITFVAKIRCQKDFPYH